MPSDNIKARSGRSIETTLRDVTTNQDYTAAIAGPSEFGPAFVPTYIRSLSGNSVNTFENIFGNVQSDKNLQHQSIYGVRSWLDGSTGNKQVCFSRTLGIGSGSIRLSSGKVDGAGFVVGSNIISGSTTHGTSGPNPHAINDGVAGRTYFLGAFFTENNENSLSSSLSYSGNRLTEQLHLTSSTVSDNGTNVKVYPIITAVIMTASGVVPTLKTKNGDLETYNDDIANDVIPKRKAYINAGNNLNSGHSIGEGDRNSNFILYLNGHIKDRNYKNIYGLSLGTPITPASSDITYENIYDALNKDPLLLNKHGHLLYSYTDVIKASGKSLKPYISDSDTNFPTYFILSGSSNRNTSTTLNPNYESFENRFTTAKTPWIVSQGYYGVNSNDNRENISSKSQVENLFRFFSLTDGESGNNQFKISIEPISLGDNDLKLYSEFDVILYSIDAPGAPSLLSSIDGNPNIVASFSRCNLNPKSENYICRKIGTFYSYVDLDSSKNKVIDKGDFLTTNPYIRVEVSERVSEGLVHYNCFPSGFRGYKHLVTNGTTNILTTETHNDFSISKTKFSSITDAPTPLMMNLFLNIENQLSLECHRYSHWGISFYNSSAIRSYEDSNYFTLHGQKRTFVNQLDATTYSESILNERYISYNKDKVEKSLLGFVKYMPDFDLNGIPSFVGDNEGTSKNANGTILDADLYNNNMFHLEKVLVVEEKNDENNDLINWNFARYRRDGRSISSINSNNSYNNSLLYEENDSKRASRYLNINKDMIGNREAPSRTNDNINNNLHFAKFQLVMQGGFDGVNIFDNDKSNFTNDACVREPLSSETSAYKKSIDLLTDDGNARADILCIPNISEHGVTRKGYDKANEKEDIFYIFDVPLVYSNSNYATGSFYKVNDNIKSDITDKSNNPISRLLNTTSAITKHSNRFLNSAYSACFFNHVISDVSLSDENFNLALVAPTVIALGSISKQENEKLHVPISGMDSSYTPSVGSGISLTSTIMTDLNQGDRQKLNLINKCKINNINPLSVRSDSIIFEDSKTSLDESNSQFSSISITRTLMDIKKKLKRLSLKRFLFDTHSRIDVSLSKYKSEVEKILKPYVENNNIIQFEVNINKDLISNQDKLDGVVRGQVILRIKGSSLLVDDDIEVIDL